LQKTLRALRDFAFLKRQDAKHAKGLYYPTRHIPPPERGGKGMRDPFQGGESAGVLGLVIDPPLAPPF
jgi:hypothetical protein